MWAMTNRHKGIAKLLLDHGASPEIRSTSGRTAFDFMPPNSELADYLHESGYIGSAGVSSDDFYDTGLAQDRFEEEMAENELKRRMMMESAINLEVDLSSLGLDEQQEVSALPLPSPPLPFPHLSPGYPDPAHQVNLPYSHRKGKRKKARNLSGIAASTTKCSSSKTMNSTASWML